jgi:lipopolysaccharide transport system ATP-binding protein
VDNFSKALYEKRQDIAVASQNTLTVEKADISGDRKYRDCRIDYINHSNLRNDIQVIQLGAESDKWGDGMAKITHVGIYDSDKNELSWIIGGEEVVVVISAIAIKNMENVFLGFQVRDRLGQVLFGDSTFLTTYDKPVELKSGCTISAKFRFVMPLLPQGVYQVHAAIASGTQREHNVHDWNTEGILFESHNQSGVNGLIGVPINQINIDIDDCE